MTGCCLAAAFGSRPRRGGWRARPAKLPASGRPESGAACSSHIGRRGRVFLLAAGTAAAGDQVGHPYRSTLGGPFRLSAFERDEFRGVRTAHVGTGYLHQLARLPDFVGGPIYGGVWIEHGWIETRTLSSGVRRPEPAPSFSAGLLADTLLGAVLGSVSIAEGSGPRINATLGRPFW